MSTVEKRPRGLAVDGRDLPLVSGAMHYFRVPPRSWGKCLRALRELGFPTVETYAPWGVHELRRGKFDFTGPRDLGAFLDAAAGEGLHAIVRPGPHINAELARFGFPERIVTDGRMQARTARGTPVGLLVPPRGFPVPSYFSDAFFDEVRVWLDAVGEVVAPRLHPGGPVIALQVDNEHAHFFRSGAYEGDYHEAAVAAFVDEHGYEPPRRFDATSPDELAPHLAWLAFREKHVVRALARLAALFDGAGLTGVRFHNFPPTEPTVFDVAAAETALDFAGIDFYQPRRLYARVRRRALYLAGSSRLPYAPELGVGSFPWGPPAVDGDALCQLLNVLGSGVAGYNAYMAVERDRWYGSPISVDGEVRPGLADGLRKVNRTLDAAGWTGLARAADVGVLVPRSYGRLALAASHLGPIGPAFCEWFGLDEEATAREATFGLDGPVQLEQARWRDAIVDGLERAHVPFVIVDGGAPLERLQRCRALVVPTFDFLEADLAARLRAFADGGGHLLTGPRRPARDATMRAADPALPGNLLPATCIDDGGLLDGELAKFVAEAGARREAAPIEPTVDTSLWRRADGAPALLFVGTRSDRPLTATVPLGERASLEDVLDGATFTGDTLAVPLQPFGVRLLRFV